MLTEEAMARLLTADELPEVRGFQKEIAAYSRIRDQFTPLNTPHSR